MVRLKIQQPRELISQIFQVIPPADFNIYLNFFRLCEFGSHDHTELKFFGLLFLNRQALSQERFIGLRNKGTGLTDELCFHYAHTLGLEISVASRNPIFLVV